MPLLVEILFIVIVSFGFVKGIDNIVGKHLEEQDRTEVTK